MPNGLPVFIFDNDRLDLIHFSLRIQAGALFEGEKSLANTTYNLLTESVPNLTSGDVEDKLDFYGAVFQSAVNFEFVTLSFIIPKSTIKNILPFISSMITSPNYRNESLDLYKQRKIKELEYNSQKVSYRANQLLFNTFLNPDLATSQILTKDRIAALTTEMLQQYHQATFCVENSSLFVSGNLDQEILLLIEECFVQIPSGEKSKWIENLLIDEKKGAKIIEKREESLQSSIMIARPAMAYEDPSRRSFSIVSTILGGYFGSRLMQNLREKNGYTYGIQATSTYFGDRSLFYLCSEVNIDKTQDAIDECRHEMTRLAEQLIESDELQTVKNYMEAALLRKLDGSVDYMRQYMLWSASGLNETEFELTKQAIAEITPEQIMTIAGQLMNPEDYTTIIVGNNTKKTQKNTYGNSI